MIFAIKNYINDKTNAYLFYYEKSKRFIIELSDKATEWNTPLIISSFARKKIKTMNAYYSSLWVSQRIIPNDRQNISQILKDNKLKFYDEFKLLNLTKGKCSQDDYEIIEINENDLPTDIKKRRELEIIEIIPSQSNNLIVFFKNGETKLCNIDKLIDAKSSLGRLLSVNPKSIYDIKIEVGGHGIYWQDNMFISSSELYNNGSLLPLLKEDLDNYLTNKIINTSQAQELLNCTRQNIEYLVTNNKVKPVKINEKNKLFLKSDILKTQWN